MTYWMIYSRTSVSAVRKTAVVLEGIEHNRVAPHARDPYELQNEMLPLLCEWLLLEVQDWCSRNKNAWNSVVGQPQQHI